MRFSHKKTATLKTIAGLFFPIFVFCCLMQPVAGWSLTNAEEKKMGQEFLKYARKSFSFVEDPFTVHYLNQLGHRLAAVFPEEAFEYKFYIIENPVYNAFAAPAGHVFINSGLISAMDSEEELAGILTHEIAHVYCRHIAEKIDQQKKISLATLAGMAAAVFLGSPALAIGSAASGQAASLAYSRQDERQADQLGVKYLCQAGYSARGLLTILEKIQSRNWFSVYDIPSYLSTHPGTDERIAYLDTLLATRNFERCRQNHQPDNFSFNLVKTKVTAFYGDPDMALKQFQTDLDKDEKNVLAHYGCGLALHRKARHAEAADHLRAALANHDGHSEIKKALAGVCLARGEYQEALDIISAMPATDWYDHEKQLLRAKAALKTGRLSESISILEAILDRRPDDNEVLYALGNSHGKKGNDSRAHYYLGLYYKNKDKPETALFHLEKALSLTDDSVRKEDIKIIIEEVKNKDQKRSSSDRKTSEELRRSAATAIGDADRYLQDRS
ncbi:MAG: M48 family metalloprotease [Desulfosudaceae bacterium]